ncbi:metalloregulator ArsR/SmtB family transcription factor [Plantactinospora sp. B6F1]|uniref:metalloregulator ArsR/SmtB family transcription factor n=1 Tax=Plantactinospora sp. B6F1 TaxID=3158971 RepID=UPI00102CAA0C
MDEVFKALADGSRRRLLDSLNTRDGQSLRELCVGLAMTRQSVSKHLAVLEAANLVTTLRRGREKLHYLNAEPVNAIADRWIHRYDQRRVQALADLKRALEQEPMGEREFVYTSYISTTPERLWQALTDPAFTSRYWGVTFDTDWRVGSEMVWVHNGVRISGPEQVVLEAEPYRRLSYAWHDFSPEFAEAYEMDPAEVAKLADEPRSRVSFEIEPRGRAVRLTVVHQGFAPDSSLLDSIGEGWSELLSSLKTLLETGEPLPQGEPEPAPTAG